MIHWKEFITTNEAVLAAKPIIKNTRLSVEFVLERLAACDLTSSSLAS
ncbi:MAG: DUF433 domain-containing protein [Bacteroidota bacterium]